MEGETEQGGEGSGVCGRAAAGEGKEGGGDQEWKRESALQHRSDRPILGQH